jgi:hypothetical protein
VYRQILINAKLRTGKRGKKTDLIGRSKGPYWTVVPSKKKKKRRRKKITFTSYLNNKNSVFSLHSARMFRTRRRKHGDCFCVKYSAVDLCNGEALFFCEVRTEVEIRFS